MNIAIIGGGISGLMCAYRLAENKDNEITIIEQGKSIEGRKCPIIEHKVNKCVHCASCDIMSGMAGAGAFSDGKYNITTEFGGWLQDYIGDKNTLNYIEQADKILIDHGATEKRFYPNNELKKNCLKNGLYMLQSECKHLGTENNLQIMKNLIDDLKHKVNIYTDSKVDRISKIDGYYWVNFSHNSILYHAPFDKVVFAVGRVGNSFLSEWCKSNNVKMENNQVDIGVRVELPSIIWEDIDSIIYEPKILYKTKQYGDTCRMFCHNPRGQVVNENTNGIITVNGHAYDSENLKSNTTNFAILSTIKFTEPFHNPIEYAKDIASLANKISGGSVIVQSFGDLIAGRRSTVERIKNTITEQTLITAVPGDLSLCMPKRQLDNIIETIYALDKIAPGTANPDTLLYGVECKFYSARPEVNEDFEVIIDGNNNSGIYAIGDGAGFTRSLAQAAAQGLFVADRILES